MTRDVAEALANAMKEMDRAFAVLDGAVSRMPDGPERDRMVDALGRTINLLHIHVSVAVAKHFPDLHPDVPGSTTY